MAEEGRLWEWFRAGLRSHGHLSRVENVVEDGMPDVNYLIKGAEGWVELKSAATLPVRQRTAVFRDCLRPAQIEWLVYRSRLGGRVFIFARADSSSWLIPGHQAPTFNAASSDLLGEIAIFSHRGRMGKENWVTIAELLADFL